MARQTWIQVSGDKPFDGSRWREAILYYLDGLWADKSRVTYRPKILFDSATLRLCESTATYYAYARESSLSAVYPWEVPQFSPGERLFEVGNSQIEVEGGLIRLVRNDRIKLLKINLSDDGLIRLWKGTRRGELHLDFARLPTMEDLLRSRREEVTLSR